MPKSWKDVEADLIKNAEKHSIFLREEKPHFAFGYNGRPKKEAPSKEEVTMTLSMFVGQSRLCSRTIHDSEEVRDVVKHMCDLAVAHDLCHPSVLNDKNKAAFFEVLIDDVVKRYQAYNQPKESSKTYREREGANEYGTYPLTGDNTHRDLWKNKEVAPFKKDGKTRYRLQEKPEPEKIPQHQVAEWLGALTGLDWQHDPETGRTFFLGEPRPEQWESLEQLKQNAGVSLTKPLTTMDGESRYVLATCDAHALKLEAAFDARDEMRMRSVPQSAITRSMSQGKLVAMHEQLPPAKTK